MKITNKTHQIGTILLFFIFTLLGSLIFINTSATSPVQAANSYDTLTSISALSIPLSETVSCTNSKAKTKCKNGNICSTLSIDEPGVCAIFGGPLVSLETPNILDQTEGVAKEDLGFTNQIANGNFEFGFYQVGQLGFEAPDIGNVPHGWGWYRNPAYGKYTIDNNQRFALVCADDIGAAVAQYERQQEASDEGATIFDTDYSLSAFDTITSSTTTSSDDDIFGPIPGVSEITANNALGLTMQSTDQQDARIGVYQIVDVTPGQMYRFTMSATIQVQAGARTLDPLGTDGQPIPQAPNNTFELYFDHTGSTNWKIIPYEERTILPIREQKLTFTEEEAISENKGISEVGDYETFVTAQSNKMTIFLTAWRKWANWRTTRWTVDCVSLVPVDASGEPIPYSQFQQINNNAVPAASVDPAADTETGEDTSTSTSTSTTEPTTQTDDTLQTETESSQESSTTTTETQTDQTATETEQTQTTLDQTDQSETTADISTESTTTTETTEGDQTESSASEETTSSIIPTSGGILENSQNTMLIFLTAIVVALGLIGAGVWNIRRNK